jgi:hypothetical protein
LIVRAGEAAATLQLGAQETNIAQRLQAIQAGQTGTEITTGISETAAETTQLEDVLSQLREVVDVDTIQQIEELIQAETVTEQATTSEQERRVQEQTLTEELASTVSDEFIDVGKAGAGRPTTGQPLGAAIAGNVGPTLPESTLPPLPTLDLLQPGDTPADIPIPEPTTPLPPQTRDTTEEERLRRRRLLEQEELALITGGRTTQIK